MQFDVIIGNPPYQLNDGAGGGGTSAVPIYQLFVQRAKELSPRYLSMIIPSRWFTGGKGLDEFRDSMLDDNRLRCIDDYLGASDVFPGVGLKGGVCYFLWDRDNRGTCRVTTRYKDWTESTATRKLLEKGTDVFIRFNEGLTILKKLWLMRARTVHSHYQNKNVLTFLSVHESHLAWHRHSRARQSKRVATLWCFKGAVRVM